MHKACLLSAILCLSMLASGLARAESAEPRAADIIVYGGTAAGIVAAVQAARMGQSVILLEPGTHLGGTTTGGLSASDVGRAWTLGGVALEFYRAVHAYYLDDTVWKKETREEYLPKHRLIYSEDLGAQWFFEPHVAERVLRGMLAKYAIPVVTDARLNRKQGVVKEGTDIVSISTEDGKIYKGKVFIDATYEGDLMAAAGVSYLVGREPNAQYGETLNGIRFLDANRAAHVDPYIVAGDPASGLLPRIDPQPPGKEGDGDHRVQAYNFRLCLTKDPDNRIHVEKPDGYNALEYETVLRHLLGNPQAKLGDFLFTLTPMPNLKTDSNNKNLFSTDYPGMSHGWAEASYAEREKIWQQHKTYTQGLLWFLRNDERVPEPIRSEVSEWGLAKDEFASTDNWPPQLYVREARRMTGEYVVTEADCTGKTVAQDPVALASYEMDSHIVSLFVDEQGRLRIEGAFFKTVPPYPVSYRALLPKKNECTNLLVPVCVSASHAAYGSMRMEPVFMMLAQAAATAAALAVQTDTPLHDLPYERLRAKLTEDQMVMNRDRAENTTEEAPESERSRVIEQAVATLSAMGVLEDPGFWLKKARDGGLITASETASVLVTLAGFISPTEDPEAAVEILAKNGIMDSPDYWLERIQQNKQIHGRMVAHLLVAFATKYGR
jgi:hypothetical protein